MSTGGTQPLTRRRTKALLLAASIALQAAGCGGAAPGATRAPSETAQPDGSPLATAEAPSQVPGPGSPTAGGQAAAACSLLADDEIRDATGHAVLSKEPSRLTSIFENGCDWTLENDATIYLGVMLDGGRAYYEEFFEPFIGEDEFAPLQEEASGIGDKAARGDLGDLMAVQRDALVEVHYVEFMADRDDDVPAELMQIVLSRLP